MEAVWYWVSSELGDEVVVPDSVEGLREVEWDDVDIKDNVMKRSSFTGSWMGNPYLLKNSKFLYVDTFWRARYMNIY